MVIRDAIPIIEAHLVSLMTQRGFVHICSEASDVQRRVEFAGRESRVLFDFDYHDWVCYIDLLSAEDSSHLTQALSRLAKVSAVQTFPLDNPLKAKKLLDEWFNQLPSNRTGVDGQPE